MDLSENRRKLKHLYSRAGFGAYITDIKEAEGQGVTYAVDRIFKDSFDYSEIKINHGAADIKNYRAERKNMSKEERQKLLKVSRQNIAKLNTTWIEKMAFDNSQLRERMTFFWHDHFACRNILSVYNQNQNNTLRRHALGSFREMVHAIAKDPAMIFFLNNLQNKKQSYNENFARELLELFTIGIGNYTEDDIKNAARAFTGWSIDLDGNYKFRRVQHDFGTKKFMGKSGDFNGDDIIDIILDDKRTAVHITSKIYSYFVNENIHMDKVNQLAEGFYNTDYDISALMKSIFTSDWFYNKENIASRVKSPVDLLAGIMRQFKVKFKNHLAMIGIQRALGQIVFNPPNVGGWVSGKKWIDSSSIMFRMKLPEIIFKSSDIEFDFKDEPLEDMTGEFQMEMSAADKRLYRQVKTSIDLTGYYNEFSNTDNEKLINGIAGFIIAPEINEKHRTLVYKYCDSSSTENMIESSILNLISLPEYQMC